MKKLSNSEILNQMCVIKTAILMVPLPFLIEKNAFLMILHGSGIFEIVCIKNTTCLFLAVNIYNHGVSRTFLAIITPIANTHFFTIIYIYFFLVLKGYFFYSYLLLYAKTGWHQTYFFASF